MSNKIRQLNEHFIEYDLKVLIRNNIVETLNALLDKRDDELVNAENMNVPLSTRVSFRQL